MPDTVQTPVALILFNRPDTTARLVAILREVRPATVLAIADGPREEHPEDRARCEAARLAIEQIDWPCELSTNYSEQNLGLKRRVETGLDWVFSRVPAAIILEDDCIPDPSFFPFCTAMLERYRNEERVMGVSGNNLLFSQYAATHSYYFSRYPHIWGWATWRRAWQLHDPEMHRWPALRDEGWLNRQPLTPAAVRYWRYHFQNNFERAHTWDYAWTLSCWLRDGLSITPAVNLVSNAGFGEGAQHTRNAGSRFANMTAEAMEFPLTDLPGVARDECADARTEELIYSGEEFVRPMFRAIRRNLRQS
jgi:hypothetical protein